MLEQEGYFCKDASPRSKRASSPCASFRSFLVKFLSLLLGISSLHRGSILVAKKRANISSVSFCGLSEVRQRIFLYRAARVMFSSFFFI